MNFDEIREGNERSAKANFRSLVVQSTDAASALLKNLKQELMESSSILDFEAIRKIGIHTADIEQNCELFKQQLSAGIFRNDSQPAIRLTPESLPIPILHDYPYYIKNKKVFNFELITNSLAVDRFIEGLSLFIAHRVAVQAYASLVGISGGMSSAPLLLKIEVTSSTFGARISYSPSYLVNYIVLAAPTSPVIGHLLPGRYIFMWTKGRINKYDTGMFDIPPDFNIPLTI